MSKKAESLVWDRARAKGSNLLVLVKIADCAEEDGRDAWPGVEKLAHWCRMTERALRLILHKLERDGELVIDHNEEGRFVLIGRRKFQPEWFLHIRCVCDWERYQAEGRTAKLPSKHFRRGRRGQPPTETEKCSDSSGAGNGNLFRLNGTPDPFKRKDHVPPIRKDPSVDPSVDQKQGAAPPVHTESARAEEKQSADPFIGTLSAEQNAARLRFNAAMQEYHRHGAVPDEDPQKNVGVIAKLAHEVLALYAETPNVTDTEISEAVKRRCAVLEIAYRSDVVSRAIDSALFQRRRAGKPSVMSGSSGEAAARLQFRE